MDRNRTSATRTRLVEEVFITGRIQDRGRKEKEYKKWWLTQKGDLVKILYVTICEVKACNRVSVKRFNILVNRGEQFFLLPQNIKFLNTFLVFLIIPLRFELPRSGDSYITTKPLKKISIQELSLLNARRKGSFFVLEMSKRRSVKWKRVSVLNGFIDFEDSWSIENGVRE